MRSKYPANKVVIAALTDEDKSTAEAWVKQNKITYAIGYGSSSGNDYGVGGIPHAFVIGLDGKIQWEGHPMDEAFENTIETLAASVRLDVDEGNKALAEAVAKALKDKKAPEDFSVQYSREVDKKTRSLKVRGSLEFELMVGEETKSGRVTDRDLRDLLKAVADSQFATAPLKIVEKTNCTIAVTLGSESREVKFDASKGLGPWGKLVNALDALYGRYSKK